MIIFDAYALTALLLKERAASDVKRALRSDERAAMVSVNLAEVVDTLIRRESLPPERIHAAIDPLLDETIQIIAADAELAWRAAAVRAAHYRRRSSDLSLADSFLLAAASTDDAIATADKPVQRVAREQGIRLVELP